MEIDKTSVTIDQLKELIEKARNFSVVLKQNIENRIFDYNSFGPTTLGLIEEYKTCCCLVEKYELMIQFLKMSNGTRFENGIIK